VLFLEDLKLTYQQTLKKFALTTKQKKLAAPKQLIYVMFQDQPS
jgi:hypothetical protein